MGEAGRRAASAIRCALWRRRGLLAALALPIITASCTTDSQPTASAATPRGGTIAFESIDGPPPGVFRKLVATLAAEAGARRITVVSRESAPNYRIRGYLAVHVVGKGTHVGWVWDVYDADRRRAFRITGEEAGARAGRDAWGSADDAMLQRIARASLDQLSAFLEQGPPPAGEPPPDLRGPAIASTRDPDMLALASPRP